MCYRSRPILLALRFKIHVFREDINRLRKTLFWSLYLSHHMRMSLNVSWFQRSMLSSPNRVHFYTEIPSSCRSEISRVLHQPTFNFKLLFTFWRVKIASDRQVNSAQWNNLSFYDQYLPWTRYTIMSHVGLRYNSHIMENIVQPGYLFLFVLIFMTTQHCDTVRRHTLKRSVSHTVW